MLEADQLLAVAAARHPQRQHRPDARARRACTRAPSARAGSTPWSARRARSARPAPRPGRRRLSTRAVSSASPGEYSWLYCMPRTRVRRHDDPRARRPSRRPPTSPSVDTTLPCSYSLVSSPRYQTLPRRSCAYQSNVSSTSCALLGGGVAHHAGGDPVRDQPGLAGHLDHDPLRGAVGGRLAVDPAAARRHRQVGVVDRVVNRAGRPRGRPSLPPPKPAARRTSARRRSAWSRPLRRRRW